MYHSLKIKIVYTAELFVVYHRAPFLDDFCSLYIWGMTLDDLFKSLGKLSPIMFADDPNLFISDSNIENLFETMNEDRRK